MNVILLSISCSPLHTFALSNLYALYSSSFSLASVSIGNDAPSAYILFVFVSFHPVNKYPVFFISFPYPFESLFDGK